MEKVVNFTCYCKKYFKSDEKILYILPCCHMIHEQCFNTYITQKGYSKIMSDKLSCPYCLNNIETILHENKIMSNRKYIQYKNNIKSVKLDTSASINYLSLPMSIIKMTTFMNKLLLVNTDEDLINTVEYLIKILNIKLNIIDNTKNNPIVINNDNTIKWQKYVDNIKKKVIISNHAHYLDCVIIYYLFRCGFISSEFITTTDIGRIIASKVKLLIFKRGVDTNMVDKIKEYLNEMKSGKIAIFPEGALVNNETMIQFRTGAFYVGATICPIVIKYDKIIYDNDFSQMILKLISQPEIKINVYINDLVDGPFDKEKIENVRNQMIKVGKFNNSQVSNKSIKE